MAIPDEVARTLETSTLFQDLSRAALDAVYDAGRVVAVEADTVLCQQGDPATSFLLVTEGRARLSQVTEDGHQVLVRFLGPGDCCGIIAAHHDAEYQATVQAVDPSAIVRWDHRTLADLFTRHPDLARNALRVLAEQCQAWQRRYREVTTARVEQRVALTVLRLAQQAGERVDAGVLIAIPLSREDLAEMTGTTLFTVSRILNRWEERGFVELGRQRVVIRDGHGLVAVSEGRRSEA
jgi:CRP-like cAMP-binding protein